MAEMLSSGASSRRGPVPLLGPDVAGDPLSGRTGPGLGGGPGHMREAGLRLVLIWGVAVGATPSGCVLFSHEPCVCP